MTSVTDTLVIRPETPATTFDDGYGTTTGAPATKLIALALLKVAARQRTDPHDRRAAATSNGIDAR